MYFRSNCIIDPLPNTLVLYFLRSSLTTLDLNTSWRWNTALHPCDAHSLWKLSLDHRVLGCKSNGKIPDTKNEPVDFPLKPTQKANPGCKLGSETRTALLISFNSNLWKNYFKRLLETLQISYHGNLQVGRKRSHQKQVCNILLIGHWICP